MRKVSLSEIQEPCKKIIEGIRLNDKDEEYSDSLNFYITNGFFFEECWNLDMTLAA